MASPLRTLDLENLAERPVSQVGLLLAAADARAIVLADDGTFAALPDVPAYTRPLPLALSYDGRRVLFWSIEDNGRTMLLVLHTLASGERRRLTAPDGSFDYRAAMSPDGRTVATLSQDSDEGFIDLIDSATGYRRRLWTFEGGASMHETSVAWSPDGRLIATTYYDAPSDELAAAVIDASTGAVMFQEERRIVLGCPNGSWVDTDRIAVVDFLSEELTPPRRLVDVRTGSSQEFARPPQWTQYLGFLDGGLIARDDAGDLYRTDLDGAAAEPFVTMPADFGFSTFDVAPSVLAT